MIAYHGTYNGKLGRSPYLGQDAIIVPVAPAPAVRPTPEPQGTVSPAVSVPAAPTPTVVVPQEESGMVRIGGKSMPIWSLVFAGLVLVGGIATIVYTTADIDKIYQRKKS